MWQALTLAILLALMIGLEDFNLGKQMFSEAGVHVRDVPLDDDTN